ncbi:hypothetical protein DN451_03835 [Lactobacillus reuteri]|nr:hypothetical protein [Limosilactobacillus reuteri]
MVEDKLHIAALNKSFVVRHTVKLVKLAAKYDLDSVKLGSVEDDTPEKQIEDELSFFDKMVDFPVSVFKLNDKDAEKLEDMDFEDLRDLNIRLSSMIQKVDTKKTDETIHALHHPEEVPEDLKSESGNKTSTN